MAGTKTGLPENVAGLLCYVLGWVSGIVFLVIESENKLVRFHAFQSIIVFGIISLVGIVFSPIPVLGTIITWIASVVGFILWIVLMVMAGTDRKYKVPGAGNLAEKWAK
ncbi:MAG: hypothetical protein C4555_00680 [Dehalococcoidia bacterium]|nr:MAG: hypothetical protein C4555_00680 [Dehalococcoidia bacterium]